MFSATLFLRSKVCSKIIPSFFTIKEGSTSHLGLLPSGKKRETALLGARNRFALRLAGHQSPAPDCGMGPPGENWREMALFDTFKYVWIVYLWFRDSLFSFWGNS